MFVPSAAAVDATAPHPAALWNGCTGAAAAASAAGDAAGDAAGWLVLGGNGTNWLLACRMGISTPWSSCRVAAVTTATAATAAAVWCPPAGGDRLRPSWVRAAGTESEPAREAGDGAAAGEEGEYW